MEINDRPENPAANDELRYHRIADIRVKKVRNRYPRLYGKNSRLPEHSYGYEFLIAEIVTDQGARGWGVKKERGIAGIRYAADGSDLRAAFVGRPVSELFAPEKGILVPEAAPLDFALHDLAGQILGMPVYRMIGEEKQADVGCYDGAIYMNDISPDSMPGGLEAIGQDCAADYSMGYRAFKVKIGRGGKWMPPEEGLARDIEVVRLIRERYPDSPILVDANDAYTVDGFFRFLDGVKDCRLYWIEEPFRENRDGLMKLKEYLARYSPETLVADGEFEPDVDEIFRLADEKLLDVMLMDIMEYGLTNWRALMRTSRGTRCRVSPHNWGSKLKTHYTAHLAKCYPNMMTIEGVPDETEGVDFRDYRLEEGRLHVPPAPGFGMKLIWGRDQ